jgi:hypothetical protein
MKLTGPQRKLLAELPESPSDGKRCKGGQYITAFNLCMLKLARVVGRHLVGGYFVRTEAGTKALAEPVELTVDQRTLIALAKYGPRGPASLSSLVWTDEKLHNAIGRGAAPGTGLVRPMLAVLARLYRKELVRWFAPPSHATRGQRKGGSDPAVWEITAAGTTCLKEIGKWPI